MEQTGNERVLQEDQDTRYSGNTGVKLCDTGCYRWLMVADVPQWESKG